MNGQDEARRTAERVARNSYGRLVAFLAARTRDVAGAEDALAEAFASALKSWPTDGVPDNPDAWLLTVARRRQTDSLRRRQTRKGGEAHVQLMSDETADAAENRSAIPDRRLALMFACAHPQVEATMRAPLILQAILGLTAADIAGAFLVAPATMGQRLVRAKARIQTDAIPFAIPDGDELAPRLASVLDAIYAAYGKGWAEIGELADEAIWLGRLVVSLLADAPEAKGMLALMLYTEARRRARRTVDGAYVPLEEQDVALWDEPLILQAEQLLREASASGDTGRYQIEAAIQSAHVARRVSRRPNWDAVVALYDVLLRLTPSPVVVLNRAAALAEVAGAEAALDSLGGIAGDKRMASYQPYWATRGHLLALVGRKAEAHEALTLAVGLAPDDATRQYLVAQARKLLDG